MYEYEIIEKKESFLFLLSPVDSGFIFYYCIVFFILYYILKKWREWPLSVRPSSIQPMAGGLYMIFVPQAYTLLDTASVLGTLFIAFYVQYTVRHLLFSSSIIFHLHLSLPLLLKRASLDQSVQYISKRTNQPTRQTTNHVILTTCS
jgi:hypothetical protein